MCLKAIVKTMKIEWSVSDLLNKAKTQTIRYENDITFPTVHTRYKSLRRFDL